MESLRVATSSGSPGCSRRRAWTLDARAIEATELSRSTAPACASKCEVDPALGLAIAMQLNRRSSTCAWSACACSAWTSIGPGHEPRRRRGRAAGPGAGPRRAVENEIADVVTLGWKGRRRGARFAPGQFNMLYVFGVGEVADLGRAAIRPRPTRAHRSGRVGAVTRAPLRPRARAGGRGARPLRTAMARRDDARGRCPGDRRGARAGAAAAGHLSRCSPPRRVTAASSLLVGARSPADLLYRDELAALAGRSGLRVGSARVDDRAAPTGSGQVGVVTAADRRGGPVIPRSTFAFICGPEVDDAVRGARRWQRAGIADAAHLRSMERNMKCAVGFCGHCQFGPCSSARTGRCSASSASRPCFDVREL